MKKLTWFLVLLIPLAMARPGYRTALIGQFNLVPDTPEIRTIGCTYCHTNASGGSPWNGFGNTLRANFKGGVTTSLYEALKSLKDSDGDGYADVLEVFAGSLPGDPTSKPNVSVQALEDRLSKAGGVDMYKPKP
jgi:hypothetical protein